MRRDLPDKVITDKRFWLNEKNPRVEGNSLEVWYIAICLPVEDSNALRSGVLDMLLKQRRKGGDHQSIPANLVPFDGKVMGQLCKKLEQRRLSETSWQQQEEVGFFGKH